ncbi:MAG: SMP-30/gluconolactonase/LRE family protein, partial [Nocardioides sp.]|nr:SMP-30/gluconolactonase/LRE family protein [Nocardioides sp.]
IAAFDIAADGSLENRRSWVEFGPEPTEREIEPLVGQVVIAPDGCGLDAEGALWVADATGGRAIRVLPDGTIDREVSPGSGVFACMLGGDGGRTLFLCSAPDFAEEARKNAREGSLLAVEVDVPRAGLP